MSLEAISLGWEINGDSYRDQGIYSGLRREGRTFYMTRAQSGLWRLNASKELVLLLPFLSKVGR